MSRLGYRTKGVPISKPRYKTWKGVNVKADIQDKDEAVKRGQHQCQSQDTGQEEVTMSKLRFMTKMNATNVTVEIQDK